MWMLVIACISANAQSSNDIEKYVEWIDISTLAPGYRACYIFESEKYLSFRVRDDVYYHPLRSRGFMTSSTGILISSQNGNRLLISSDLLSAD